MAEALLQPFPMREASRGQVWTYCPTHRRPRHFHVEPELNLVVAGTATFAVGDATRVVRAGELLSFAPGQEHELIGASRDLLLFAAGSSPALAASALDSGSALAGPLHARLASNDRDTLIARCANATGEAGRDDDVAELWHVAAWSCRRAELSTPHVLTRRALAALGADPRRCRGTLAADGRSHPSELSRHFRRDLGHTLVEHRARLRLLRFIELVDGGASQTAAALDAGFGSYSQCHRVFRSTLGCAPRAFFEGALRRRMADTFAPALQ